ncbi:MAG: nucleoside triphosphate pyrophosphohydrolase [Oscillospiraceae bacterium]|nr:nucleoside triphosphate pyrophosphohydrolase [Oscillospiraceae bacterium]
MKNFKNFKGKNSYNIDDLLEIMAILRKKCPWDKQQTHSSVRINFLEEVYEVLEAIDSEDTELLREELGDVLLQVVFHAQMESEAGKFTFSDVCDEVCRKLIIRHPHIFGDTVAEDTAQVLENWENIKNKTKGHETRTQELEAVAKSLPALMYAQKIGKRAAGAGLDFESEKQAFECIYKELTELREAMDIPDRQAIENELGDVLFSCVNTARHLGIDAETALRKSAEKFIKRFSNAETLIRQQEMLMQDLTAEELDKYWQKAKETV